jgi:ribonucleotide monophosphatase NagD (HAD superfamily)
VGHQTPLKEAVQATVPVVFLTNGGGAPESVRARHLSELFRTEIKPQQLVLGHTPFRTLVPRFGDKPVLVLGRWLT